MPNHIVVEGDCLTSIAEQYGFIPEDIWLLPENATLRDKRSDPNVLYPGDKVFIPEKRMRTEAITTESLHQFRRNNIPEIMRVILEDHSGRPFANVNYRAVFDTLHEHSGKTGSDGLIEHVIPKGAISCEVTITLDEEQEPTADQESLESTSQFADCWDDQPMESYGDDFVTIDDDSDEEGEDTEEEDPDLVPETYVFEIQLGHLDPLDETTGLQQRLANLGYNCGPDDGVVGKRTRAAIEEFQADQGLPVTGAVDARTNAALESAHHS